MPRRKSDIYAVEYVLTKRRQINSPEKNASPSRKKNASRQESSGDGWEYLLKWKGWDQLDWVPESDLLGCELIIQEMHERQETSNLEEGGGDSSRLFPDHASNPNDINLGKGIFLSIDEARDIVENVKSIQSLTVKKTVVKVTSEHPQKKELVFVCQMKGRNRETREYPIHVLEVLIPEKVKQFKKKVVMTSIEDLGGIDLMKQHEDPRESPKLSKIENRLERRDNSTLYWKVLIIGLPFVYLIWNLYC